MAYNVEYMQKANEIRQSVIDYLSSLAYQRYNNEFTYRQLLKNISSYDVKVSVCGNFVKLIKYKETRVFKNSIRKNKNGSSCRVDNGRSDFSLHRTRRMLAELVYSNFTYRDSFLTLTFSENLTDIKKANQKFDLFRRKFKDYLKELGYDFKYVAIHEYQKRGAVHYHIFLFDVPYIPYEDIKNMWTYGTIQINKIDNNRKAVNYVRKYISKNLNLENEELNKDYYKAYEKIYDRSRNLKNPLTCKMSIEEFNKLNEIIHKKDVVYKLDNPDFEIEFFEIGQAINKKVILDTVSTLGMYKRNEIRSNYIKVGDVCDIFPN